MNRKPTYTVEIKVRRDENDKDRGRDNKAGKERSS